VRQLEKLSHGGTNAGVGPLHRTPGRYRWEVGMPSSRITFEARCEADSAHK